MTAQFRRGKWGNSAIVTRYRLDSQFHCSYLESRGVPGKNAGKKNTGNYFPFISGSRLPVASYPVMQLPVTSYPVTSLLPIAPPQMRFELSLYTTVIYRTVGVRVLLSLSVKSSLEPVLYLLF